MKQVKGSMVKLAVKAAKANKSGIYQKKLSEQTLQLLNEKILDAVWYPFELHKELYNLVAQVEAGNSPKVIFEWGKKYGETLMTSMYRRAIDVANMSEAVAKHRNFHRQVYSFGTVEAEFSSDSDLVISYRDFERDWEAFYHMAFGWTLRFLELCSGEKVSWQYVNKSWEKDSDKDTACRFYW